MSLGSRLFSGRALYVSRQARDNDIEGAPPGGLYLCEIGDAVAAPARPAARVGLSDWEGRDVYLQSFTRLVRLVVSDNGVWGFPVSFRRRGGEVGDFLKLTLKPPTRNASILVFEPAGRAYAPQCLHATESTRSHLPAALL
jgi:hypothetical protein